jgi:hypothetical protein
MLNQPFRGIVCFQGLNRHFVSRFFNMPLSFGPRRRGLTLSENDILHFFEWEGFSEPFPTSGHRRPLRIADGSGVKTQSPLTLATALSGPADIPAEKRDCANGGHSPASRMDQSYLQRTFDIVCSSSRQSESPRLGMNGARS